MGEFEEIEEALVEAGIPFDRETVADYGDLPLPCISGRALPRHLNTSAM